MAFRARMLLTAALLGASWGAAAEEAKPITLGVLTDMSGTSMDLAGPGSVAATQMAVDDFGGSVLGRPVKVIAADHQLKPDIGANIARKWYDDGVDLILDVPVSAVGLAVKAISDEKKRLFITSGTLTSDFTGKFCSKYSMQWDFNTTALANATAGTAVQQGLKRWYFLTADYAFGYSLERDATKVITANGGTVVGSIKHPFNYSDLTSFVVQALASDAQAIALANGPPDNVTALKEATEFGLAGSGKTVVGLFFVITDISALGLPAAQGLIFTEAFYWDEDAATRAWSQRFYAKIGKMPTSAQAADYSAATHWLQAVKATGTTDAETVAEKMREMPVVDMFAHGGHLRIDGAMVHDLLLVKVKRPDQSTAPWDVYQILAKVPGEQAFPRLEDENCPLVHP